MMTFATSAMTAVAALLGRTAPSAAARCIAASRPSALAYGTGSNNGPTNKGPEGSKKSSIAEPSYFYASPGSSLREPIYVSLTDPVYFYDAKRSSLSDAVSIPGTAQPAASQQQQHQQPQSKSKLPLDALMGAGKVGKKEQQSKPHPYKLVDDLAQQAYHVAGPRNSMREPRYVSISDPIYVPGGADKKK